MLAMPAPSTNPLAPLIRASTLRISEMRISEPDCALRIGRAAIVWLSLVLLLAGCASRGARQPAAGAVHEPAMPPFYRIDGDGGSSLLLMGTVHVGPPEGWQFSPALLEGLDGADRIVLEIDIREATEDSIGTLLANSAVIQPPNSLADLVSPETTKLLDENDATLAEMGMPRNARNWKKPWYIALWLLESVSSRSGFAANASADSVIFEALGARPLIGLETVEEQLRIFDGLSPEIQDLMLQDALLRLDAGVEEIHSLVAAWHRGDERRLEELARDGIDELPARDELYNVLLADRNRRWLSVFRTLLDGPEYAGETIFVGVGALHLVGDDGLVHLLRESGYDAMPIDQRAENK